MVVVLFEANADLDLLVAMRTIKQGSEMAADKAPFGQLLGTFAARFASVAELGFVHKRIVDVADDIGFERQLAVEVPCAGLDKRLERLRVIDFAEKLRCEQTVVERTMMRKRRIIDAENLGRRT